MDVSDAKKKGIFGMPLHPLTGGETVGVRVGVDVDIGIGVGVRVDVMVGGTTVIVSGRSAVWLSNETIRSVWIVV